MKYVCTRSRVFLSGSSIFLVFEELIWSCCWCGEKWCTAARTEQNEISIDLWRLVLGG